VAFGYRKPEHISAPLEHVRKFGVNFVKAKVTAVDVANRKVKTTAREFTYDALVVSLGAETIETGFPPHVGAGALSQGCRDSRPSEAGGTS